MKINAIIAGPAEGWRAKMFKDDDFNKVICFDPFEDNEDNKNIISVKKCLFSESCEKKFYVCNKRQCSSLFKPNYDFIKDRWKTVPEKYKIDKEITVDCDILDNHIQEKDEYDLFTIDTQGAELDIIKGAKNSTDKIKVMLVEIYNKPFYENSSLFKETDPYIKSLGFDLVGKLRGYDLFDDYFYVSRKYRKTEQVKFIHNKYRSRLKKP